MAQMTLDEVTKVFVRRPSEKGIDKLSLEIRDGEFMSSSGRRLRSPRRRGRSPAWNRSPPAPSRLARGWSTSCRKSRDIEMVFQNYALYPHMTLRLNLAFGLQQRKTRGASASPRPQRNPGKRPTPRISPAGAQHQPGLGDRH